MSAKIGSLKQISAKYTTFFFDLDGVLWKGPEKIKGAFEALEFLRQQKKRMFFVTNNSTRNRATLKQKFLDFGFEPKFEELIPSDYITSLYLRSRYPDVKKVLVIGKPSLAEQIRSIGKQVWHLTDKENITQTTDIPKIVEKIDKSVDCVIFGYDFEISYLKLCLASLHVQNGAKFIATNPDQYTMIGGYRIPGNGSMVRCVEVISGVKAEVAGKPNPFILNYIMETEKLKKQECLMVGDNLDTDIQFGRNGQIDTLCVLTGNSTQKMVLSSQVPTYYCQYLL